MKRINANEALCEEEINNSKRKCNIWYPSIVGEGSYIKIDMSQQMLSNILDKKMLSCPYVFVFCILYYVLKIEKYGDTVTIDVSHTQQLYQKTTTILNDHKFYSIIERDNIMRCAQSQEELQELLSSFDNDNAKLIGEILGRLKFASDLDIRRTNERLSSFLENLKADVWFTLKTISLDYHQLESIDTSQRKEFLKDVELLIQKYTDKQKTIKNTETY